MTVKSWVQCPKSHKLIPKEEYYENNAPSYYIMRDIEPYTSMIDGSLIKGRRQHREHLRQHNCIEVGNEKMNMDRRSVSNRADIRRTINEAIRKTL